MKHCYLNFFLSIAFFSGCKAQSDSEVVEAILKDGQSDHKQAKNFGHSKKNSLAKDKKGNYIVPWEVLEEYQLGQKKLSNNLNRIINKNVTIKGFMVPLDFSAKSIKEFLLVPYIPSCSHVPPPPPNMTISVKFSKKKKAIRPSYYPVEVIGTINIKKPIKQDPYFSDGVYSMMASGIKELHE